MKIHIPDFPEQTTLRAETAQLLARWLDNVGLAVRIERLAARLRHVLATYPSVGTLCLWEQECHGVRGWQEGA